MGDVKIVSQLLNFNELEFYNHLQERIIILNNDIDDEVVESGIIQILKWNREDEKLDASEVKGVEIILNSAGGAVDIGMVLCDVIKASKTPITITVLGIAASMGGLILMSGKHRRAYKHSNILIHDGSMFLGGTSGKVKDHMKFQEEKEAQLKKFILENTKITDKKYEEMHDREWWLTAEQALEYGIIDEII